MFAVAVLVQIDGEAQLRPIDDIRFSDFFEAWRWAGVWRRCHRPAIFAVVATRLYPEDPKRKPDIHGESYRNA